MDTLYRDNIIGSNNKLQGDVCVIEIVRHEADARAVEVLFQVEESRV
jgi:hypothetical protein